MTTIAQVRDQLKDALRSVHGWTVAAYPYDEITPPSLHLDLGEYDPRMVFSGSAATYPFTVRAFANRTAEVASMKRLDALREPTGSGSLIAAVQDESNWGAVDVDYAQVVRVGRTVEAEVASKVYLMVEFDLEIVW